MMELRDLPPRSDPKGGSPKTPPNGIPSRQYEEFVANCVTLEKYFETRLEALDRRVSEAQETSKTAVDKASTAMERRLDLLNEFRDQSKDETQRFATRDTVEVLSRQMSRLYGGLAVVGIIGIANLVKVFLTH